MSPVCCNLPLHSPPGAPSFAAIVSAVVTSRICFLPCSDEREELEERAEAEKVFVKSNVSR